MSDGDVVDLVKGTVYDELAHWRAMESAKRTKMCWFIFGAALAAMLIITTPRKPSVMVVGIPRKKEEDKSDACEEDESPLHRMAKALRDVRIAHSHLNTAQLMDAAENLERIKYGPSTIAVVERSPVK